VTGPQSGTLSITFHGCSAAGKQCETAGAGEGGNIESKPLVTQLGWIDEPNGEVGEDYQPAAGNVFTEFNCGGGLGAKVFGSVVGVVKVLNAMSQEQEVELIANNSTQIPEKLDNMPRDVLSVEFSNPSGTLEAAIALKWRITNEPATVPSRFAANLRSRKPRRVKDPTETRTAGLSTPEHGRCQRHHGGAFTNSSCTGAATGTQKGKYEWHPI
jgi:hypothetical protein